jgi:hypothetical protein
MTFTSHSKDAAPRIIDKMTEHPLGILLLGEVVACVYMDNALVLYYADGRKAGFVVDEDGDIQIGDYDVKTC